MYNAVKSTITANPASNVIKHEAIPEADVKLTRNNCLSIVVHF